MRYVKEVFWHYPMFRHLVCYPSGRYRQRWGPKPGGQLDTPHG
jgi:hypothetical protein